MSITDYMSDNGDGTISVNCASLPSKAFIDAYKVVDVRTIKMHTKEEKSKLKAGTPDVSYVCITGERGLLDRRKLQQEFKMGSGKKVRLAYLKNNTPYLVYKNCYEKYKVMKLPDNFIGNFNTKKVQNGSYIICREDSNGNADISSASIISEKNFRKLFKIPMQNIIKKHSGGKGNRAFTLFKQLQNTRNKNSSWSTSALTFDEDTPAKEPNTIKNEISLGGVTTEQLNEAYNTTKTPTRASQTPKSPAQPASARNVTATNNKNAPARQIEQANSVNNNNTQPKYRYTVTHRIVSMNNESKLLGFIVKDIKTNKSKQIPYSKVMEMCRKRLIDNLVIVTKDVSGVAYLRGNGIRIESLPKVIA